MDIISVVLGADTKKDRTKDSIKIIEYAYANYQEVDLAYILHEEFDKIVEKTSFNITKGINNDLTLKLSENTVGLYPVNKKDIKDINCETEIETDFIAPVHEGQKLRKNKT